MTYGSSRLIIILRISSYLFTNCFEITVELSCCKFPERSRLQTEWSNNYLSLIRYLQSAHIGIKGLVTDDNNNPINDAIVSVEGIDKPVNTTERGEFWRLLVPGKYRVRAQSPSGKISEVKEIEVPEKQNSALRVDFRIRSDASTSEIPEVVHRTSSEPSSAKPVTQKSFISFLTASLLMKLNDF